MQRHALIALVLATLLAGCSGGSTKGNSGDDFDELDLQATEDTGVARGVVFNEAIVPLADVGIELTGAGAAASVNATTGADGLFGFDGLAPGTYFLTASKPGFLTSQTTVDVVAGVDEPDSVKVMMFVDAANLPYPTQYVMEGFISCSARIALTAVPAGECQQSDESQASYEMDRRPDWAQSEMVWKSTQALGDAMSLVSECFSGDASDPDPCPDGNLVVNRSEGSSPLIIKFNATLLEQFRIGESGGNNLRLRVFSAGREDTDLIDEDAHNAMLNETTGGTVECLEWPPGTNDGCFRFTGFGVIINQAFKIYTTVFYGYTPPEDWLFIETNKVPDPPA